MNRQQQIAYAAGFFDGEGHIRICRHSKRGSYMLQVSAVQSTPEPIEFLVSLFGGTFTKRLMQYRGIPKVQYTWQASSKAAESALLEMLPCLLVKKDEANLALEFRSTFRPQFGDRSKMPPEIEEKREAMMIDMQRLRKSKREAQIKVA